MDLALKEIIEGRTRLIVPVEGKLTKKDPVFYNPIMELNRDISVAVASVDRPVSVCDLLAGTGARGVRIANEAGSKVFANDLNPDACELIRRNALLNRVDVEVTNMDGNCALSDRRFDYIDVDPFGPPVRFIDSAIRAVNQGGILGVTATDTSALCGSSPKACQKKYDALSLRSDYYNELGLRILIGHIARVAMRHEKGILPLFSHSTRHYFKTYVRVKRGPGDATETLGNLGFLQHCFSCRFRAYEKLDSLAATCVCGSKLHTCGPLWTGRYADPVFCRKLQKEFSEGNYGMGNQALALARTIELEQAINLPYYDVHKVARSMGVPARSMGDLVRDYERLDMRAVRTHFCGTGLRIDGKIGDISAVIANDLQ